MCIRNVTKAMKFSVRMLELCSMVEISKNYECCNFVNP